MRNAEDVCLDKNPPDPDSDEVCKKSQLEVPLSSEIVQRRNYILDLMKTRSTLSGSSTTRPSTTRRRKSRSSSSRRRRRPGARPSSCGRSARRSTSILCPDDPDRLHRRSTPAAIASRRRSTGTCRRSPRSTSTSRPARRIRATHGRSCAITRSRLGNGAGSSTCAGRNIHNAASAVMDYRTGEVLAYVGSARYTARATRSSSRSSMSCPTAGASRVHRSSRSTTPSASTTRPTPQARCSWTS